MKNSTDRRRAALEAARQLAQWHVDAVREYAPDAVKKGCFPFYIAPDGEIIGAYQWNLAFAIMGLLSAEKVLGGDGRFCETARIMAEYLKTLQIPENDPSGMGGAIREQLPDTPWCYTRDGLSGAWGFLEYYRATGDRDYLHRAILWAEWFMKFGMDETGWPKWGVVLGTFDAEKENIPMCLDLHGCFQGGSLNFFYHLALETGDDRWIGPFFRHIADYFCDVIQQPDGLYRTVAKQTGPVPENDPQNGLHRINDDLGSLGLLCAYRVTASQKYLDAVERYLTAASRAQRQDGHFESSCAAIPVALNTFHEAAKVMPVPAVDHDLAIDALLSRQFTDPARPELLGGLNELGDGALFTRSMAYALIYLLKIYGGDQRFLHCG